MPYKWLAVGGAGFCLFLLGLAVSSSAITVEKWAQAGAVLHGQLPMLATQAGEGSQSEQSPEVEAIAYARFSATTTVPAGVEIELWPIGADGASPDSSFGRNLWITDERTAGTVSFDITRIAQAWESGLLPNNGVVLHVVEGESTNQAMAVGDSPVLWGAPTLTVHTMPIADNPQAPPTPPTGHGRRQVRDVRRVTQSSGQ